MEGIEMYVRYNVDSSGRIYLQQLLRLNDGLKLSETWENIPLSGRGNSESIKLPVGLACGIFFIEEQVVRYGESKDINNIFIVPALSILRISEAEYNRTRIDLHDKQFYFINIPQIDFIKLMTGALSKFMIINVDHQGNITNL
jgi:hypothetical protein